MSGDGILPSSQNCVYTSCYCEENVWKLCEFVKTQRTAPLEQLLVVFISNENRMVPLWKQKSGRGDQPVIWLISSEATECSLAARPMILGPLTGRAILEIGRVVIGPAAVIVDLNKGVLDYHVVLMRVGLEQDSLVYDLDSLLPFPCSLKLYAAQALRSDRNISPEYHRKLRVVPADSFLLNFASDRSHMKNSDGSWRMPPPSYPPLQTAESQMNLDDFISMDPGAGCGMVLRLQQFLDRYSSNSSSASSSISS